MRCVTSSVVTGARGSRDKVVEEWPFAVRNIFSFCSHLLSWCCKALPNSRLYFRWMSPLDLFRHFASVWTFPRSPVWAHDYSIQQSITCKSAENREINIEIYKMAESFCFEVKDEKLRRRENDDIVDIFSPDLIHNREVQSVSLEEID